MIGYGLAEALRYVIIAAAVRSLGQRLLSGDISIGNWPSSGSAYGEPWYVVKAVADLTAGGSHQTVYVGSSFTNQIFSAHEGD